MDIDKTDFVAFLVEFGSDIVTSESSFKGIYVPLQRSKQLLDVKLEPGDAVVYTDPAESLTLGEMLSFRGKSFLLVSNSKIQYINGNPIYMELGFQRFLPTLILSSEYQIRTSFPFSINSVYAILQNLFSKSVPSAYDIPMPISSSLNLASGYDIAQNLFSKSVPSAYDIPESVSASLHISSLYGILTAPAQVTGLRAEFNSPETIALYWNALDPDSFDHYEVHRSTSSGFSPNATTLVDITSANRFINHDLDSDTTYYFKVCAVDSDGSKGTYSSQVSETTSGV